MGHPHRAVAVESDSVDALAGVAIPCRDAFVFFSTCLLLCVLLCVFTMPAPNAVVLETNLVYLVRPLRMSFHTTTNCHTGACASAHR